jgi:hypothetical protein
MAVLGHLRFAQLSTERLVTAVKPLVAGTALFQHYVDALEFQLAAHLVDDAASGLRCEARAPTELGCASYIGGAAMGGHHHQHGDAEVVRPGNGWTSLAIGLGDDDAPFQATTLGKIPTSARYIAVAFEKYPAVERDLAPPVLGTGDTRYAKALCAMKREAAAAAATPQQRVQAIGTVRKALIVSDQQQPLVAEGEFQWYHTNARFGFQTVVGDGEHTYFATFPGRSLGPNHPTAAEWFLKSIHFK